MTMTETLIQNAKPIAIIIGILIGYPFMLQRKEKLHTDKQMQVFLLCLLFSFLSVLSAALFASFERVLTGKGFSFGGLSMYGVYLFCPLFFFPLVPKRYRADYFDCLAVYVIPSLILQRVSCFLSGCCYGDVIPSTSFRWPTRETEILFYILVFLFLKNKEKDQNVKEGALFPYLMISYGIFRFFNECFRYSDSSGLFHLGHIWSVLAVIVGWSVYTELRKSKHR